MNVREFLDALQHEAEKEKLMPYEQITDLQTAIIEFLKNKFADKKSRNTVKTYYSDLISFLEDVSLNEFPDSDNIILEDITRDTVINHLRRFSHANRWQNTDREIESKVSEASVEKRYRSLRAFTNWLLDKGIVGTDWMWKIKKPHVKSKIPSAWPYEYILKFFETFDSDDIKGHRDLTLCILLTDTALRIGEVVELREGNIDWAAKTLLVDGKVGQRVCSFSDTCAEELQKWIKRKNRELPRTTLIFPAIRSNGHDYKMLATSVSHIIRDHARDAGIPDTYKLGPHSLRHAAGAHLARSKVNLKLVQKQFGHSKITTTQIYEEITMDDVRDTINQHSLWKKVQEMKEQDKVNNAISERLKRVRKKKKL